MQFDKNAILGFVLLAVMFLGFFYFTRQGQLDVEKQQRHIQDSLAMLQPKVDSSVVRADSVHLATQSRVAAAGQFVTAVNAGENETVLENDVLKITFTNKGAQPKRVQLKHYKSIDSQAVKLVEEGFDKLSYPVNTAANRSIQISDLFFDGGAVTQNADGSQTITYQLKDSSGQGLIHRFTLRKDQYMVDWSIEIDGVNSLLTQNSINLLWQNEVKQHEKDIITEKRETQVGFWTKNEYDYFTLGRSSEKQFESPVHWLSVKQKFFNTTLIAKNNFSSGNIHCSESHDSTGIITAASANLKLMLPAGNTAVVPLQIYYGPNDYDILKSYDIGLQDVINLGQGIYAFVKYINKWLVMPVFDFFKGFVGSYGMVIALLTIFIRLLTSPLVYTSYLSGAKMKALRPELDILKAKLKDDQQAYAMEQMKVYRSAGVNPLGGCIPALLQIPIFFSLYSFFNATIELRGQHFLWATDLSSYDSILTFGFNIPFYGNHISLFTILATVTSLLISIYSMAQTPNMDNPMMKYMPYFFPVMLLGIFNGLPSALTWYYTVSNVITLILQYVIQNFIIDHDKILAKLELNKKKPKVKSKWQERLEQMQETQKKLQQTKSKPQGGGKGR
ncbi:membrane protein insertase YidC [Agriterribacter sp.]|mgnify:FL=1|uniref:membrane protein insertase YidC n=1 Tax=Agriterribacter sp. TaxID=2821509 RepID=UPI002C7FABAF|nr:membrane protein insertase YidC [Agriterribacter sp.]HRO48105.1 membrane protein insertase YidC [Agriterribacter sp.]HRQ17971.1 membrane protein insertase YidC [Agriterribacter sp.]